MSYQIEIYVADLAAYNNAILHSVCINVTLPFEDMWGQIRAMLDKSPVENAEEYVVHDHSGFEGAPVSGWERGDWGFSIQNRQKSLKAPPSMALQGVLLLMWPLLGTTKSLAQCHLLPSAKLN